MIKNLNKEDVIEYLMTSDFNNLSNSEYIYLLYYLRNLYRNMCSKKDNIESSLNFNKSKLEAEINMLYSKIQELSFEKVKLQTQILELKNKKPWWQFLKNKVK